MFSLQAFAFSQQEKLYKDETNEKLKLPNEEEEYDNDEFNEGEEPNSKGELKQRELFAIDSMTNGMTGSV